MAAIYSTHTGETITDGLQDSAVCDHALHVARRIAKELAQTVILDDDDGEWLVGPRGGVRRFTPALKRQYGFTVEGGRV